MRFSFRSNFLLVISISFLLTGCTALHGDVIPKIPNSEVSKEDQLRAEVIQFAKKQLGSKYRYGGKDPRGFDCSGLTYFVLNEFDVKVSGSSKYQEDDGVKIKVKEVKPGDLVFFRRTKASKVFHVAMVVENNKKGLKVIHSTSRGVVIDNISQSKYWKPKLSSARDVLSK